MNCTSPAAAAAAAAAVAGLLAGVKLPLLRQLPA
jgi:hypothetical protein